MELLRQIALFSDFAVCPATAWCNKMHLSASCNQTVPKSKQIDLVKRENAKYQESSQMKDEDIFAFFKKTG